MVRAAVLLCDAELREFNFEAVGSAAVPGGEHESVVSHGRLGGAVGGACGAEGVQDDGADDRCLGGHGHDVVGVAESDEDLGVGFLCGRPVREV